MISMTGMSKGQRACSCWSGPASIGVQNLHETVSEEVVLKQED